MFQTVPLSIIRSFSLYTQQWYTSYSFADSLRAGSGCKLYMFRTVPLSIIRSFLLYTRQWYMSYRFADSCQVSAELYDIYHSCVYSEKLLMIDRGTVRNM